MNNSTLDERPAAPSGPPAGPFAPLYKIPLRRDTRSRWIGGVCAGIAARLGWDPLLVRAIAIVLGLFGIGVPIYLIAWLLVPTYENSLLLQRAGRGEIGAVVLTLVVILMLCFSPFVDGGVSLAVLVVVGLVSYLTLRDSRPGVSASETGAPPVESDPRSFDLAPAITPASPRLRRPSIGGAATSLLVGVAVCSGAVAYLIAEAATWSVSSLAVGWLAALTVFGVGLLIVGIKGRSAWAAISLAVVTALVTPVVASASTLVSNPGVGEVTWRPSAADPVSTRTFEHGLGEAVLDLSKLSRERSTPIEYRADLDIGSLQILVPEGMSTRVEASVDIGEINAEQVGLSVDSDRADLDIGDTEPVVIVAASVGLGEVVVRRP